MGTFVAVMKQMRGKKGSSDVFRLASLVLFLAFLGSVALAIHYYRQSESKDVTITEARLAKEKFLSEKLAADKLVYQREKELEEIKKLKREADARLEEKMAEVEELEKLMVKKGIKKKQEQKLALNQVNKPRNYNMDLFSGIDFDLARPSLE